MHSIRMAESLLLAAALTMGCADRNAPVEPVKPPPVSFNFNNNPDGGSPHVFRFQDFVFFVIFDGSLAAVHSSSDAEGGCGPGSFFGLGDFQEIVEDPSAGILSRVHQLAQAKQIYIAVVDLNQAGNCFGLAKVADGIGKWQNTDNDLAPFLRDDNNHNAFGAVAQGTLQRPSGASAQYNGVGKCVWDGHDFATLKCVDKINLR